MKRLTFPELDAEFEDRGDAVLVRQRGRSYRARRWRLTEGLEHTINRAVHHGYTCFWVEGHPSQPYLDGQSRFGMGSHCITFARRHDQKWIFVADKPPHSHEICFTRGLRDFLEGIEQEHEWEHSGGHNLRVPLDRLDYILERLGPEVIDNLHRRAPPTNYVGARSVVGLANEAQLHAHLVATWAPLLHSRGYVMESKAKTGPKSVPDLLLHANDEGLLVIELKFTHVSLVEHDQLLKYLRSPRVLACAGDRPVSGALVGRDFSPQLVRIASAPGSRTSLYSFAFSDGRLTLHLIAGPRVLNDVLLGFQTNTGS